jgi:hypothetical protein
MNNWRGGAGAAASGRPDYSRLPPSNGGGGGGVTNSTGEDDWVSSQRREHKTQLAEQDRHLEDIGRGVDRLGEISLEVSAHLSTL